MSRKGKRRPAFSLVELMVVIAIIGLLAGAVAIGARNYLERGRRTRVRMDLIRIEEALESFYLERGRYPDTSEGLTPLTLRTDSGDPPWLNRMPTDPWGNEYQYVRPGDRGEPYAVICFGSDGTRGGQGDAADISHIDLKEP